MHMADCRDEEIAALIIHRVNTYGALVEALEQSQDMIKEALPQFNWGASGLDGDACRLLNQTPAIVAKAIELAKVQP
jgi:hypothetical protein